jgi:hypothetical protein
MTARLDLTLASGNAAFTDNPAQEVARILRALAQRIDDGAEGQFSLRDVNGNACGSAFLGVWVNSDEEA